VFINPVRQRLVEKIELYEEGRILTSDLLSSGESLCKCPNQFHNCIQTNVWWGPIWVLQATREAALRGNFIQAELIMTHVVLSWMLVIMNASV